MLMIQVGLETDIATRMVAIIPMHVTMMAEIAVQTDAIGVIRMNVAKMDTIA